MPLIYNGTEIPNNGDIIYNSTSLTSVIYNGTEVWKKQTVDPTKDSFTEEEFIAICNAGLQSQMHTGATITIANSVIPNMSTYEVIGINHDGTTNTVDIMAHEQVGNMAFGSSQTYSSSSIRTWINGTYLSAFSSTIQSLAKTMSVVSQSSTLNDKVKLLSASELGVTPLFYMDTEGSAYSVFSTGAYSSSIANRWRGAGSYGNSGLYWLRSRHTYKTIGVWSVYSSGSMTGYRYSNSYGVLPVLRF